MIWQLMKNSVSPVWGTTWTLDEALEGVSANRYPRFLGEGVPARGWGFGLEDL